MAALALALARHTGRVGDAEEVVKTGGGTAAAGACVYFGAGAAAPLCYTGGKWVTGAVIEYGGKIIDAVKCTFTTCGAWKGSNRDEAFEGTRSARFYETYNPVMPLCKTDACKARWLELANWYIDGWKNVDITQSKYQSESTAESINVFKDYGWQRYLDDVGTYYEQILTPGLQVAMAEMLNQQEIDLGNKPGDSGAPAGDPAKAGMSTGTKITVAALGAGALFAGWRYWKKGKIL